MKRRVESLAVLFIVLGLGVITKVALAAPPVSDTATVYSGIAFSVACFVVLVLAGILIRRFSARRKNDLADDAGLDLMGMRQKNLLTPEEMKMVSAAIARRMAEKETRQKQIGAASTAALLHDPEVLRLQELAQAKRDAAKSQRSTVNPNASAPPSMPQAQLLPNDADHRETPPQFPGDPIPTEHYNHSQSPADEDLDGIALPPEVQQLADAGILTPEEIQNVKRRLKARG